MDSTTYRGLAFLLSLGTLPIACNPEGDGGTDDGTGGTSDATDGAGTTSGAPTTSTDGMSTESGTTGSTETTGEPGGSCASYVGWLMKCDPDGEETPAQLYSACSMQRKRVEAVSGPVCLAAFDAVNECLAAASCDDPDPCADQIDAELNCFPEAGEACLADAAKQSECYGEPVPDYVAGACQFYVNDKAYYFGSACGAAFEEWYVCLVDLPCPDYLTRNGCDAEQAKIDVACGGP